MFVTDKQKDRLNKAVFTEAPNPCDAGEKRYFLPLLFSDYNDSINQAGHTRDITGHYRTFFQLPYVIFL